MNQIYSPQKKDIDAQTARSSPMSEIRYGGLEVKKPHPVLSFFLKLSGGLNAFGWGGLWTMFRIKDLFPPHDAPFMDAIGWYFVFGGICCGIAAFVFNYARMVEAQAIVKALTHNRRYEWHSSYDTGNVSENDLKKVPEARMNIGAAAAVGAGRNFFMATGILVSAGLFIFLVGARMIIVTLF
jgi:hypothetical protein